ncbi:MAG: PE-PPE domain-containing protein [Mycobacterium sp.]
MLVTDVYQSDYALTSEGALVMIPASNQQWLDLANSLYLQPAGFDGTPVFLQVPETYDLNASVSGATQILVDKIESLSGTFSAADPLYIFGYSQATVVAGMAEQQLKDYGIPQDDLHFVLVGDSASAYGGFLNEFMDTLYQYIPASWDQSAADLVNQLFSWFNTDSVLGAVTPDNLYPTNVYTLTGDGWTNWDNGANLGALFSDHLEYLGLTQGEVGSATLSMADDLTNYWTIDSAAVDGLSALWNSLMMAVSPFVERGCPR